MVTADDAKVINALKREICCPCHAIKHLVIGVLLGALVTGLAAFAGWHIASNVEGYRVSHRTVVTSQPSVSCPAPVIDTGHLASVCMNWHHPEQTGMLIGRKK